MHLPTTPRVVWSDLMTSELLLKARIGTGGLYLAIKRAKRPVSVKTTISSTGKSRTVFTAVEATVSAVTTG